MRTLLLAGLAMPLCAQAVTLQISSSNPTCTSSNGSIDVSVFGGAAPYTYVWDDGPVTEDRTGLAAGTYTVTVTDANADTDQEIVVLTTQPDLGMMTFSYIIDGQANFPCPGTDDGIAVIPLYENPQSSWFGLGVGVPPYAAAITVNGGAPVSPSGTDAAGNPWFPGITTGDMVQILVTDAEGCQNAYSASMAMGPQVNGVWVSGTSGACAGGSNGSISFGAGDFLGYFGLVHAYDDQMNLVASTDGFQDPLELTGLPAGDYTLYYTYGPPPTYVCEPTYFASATVDDLGTNCGTVQGTLYIDNDQDCVQDGAEVPVRHRLLEILPGPEYAITDENGHYLRDLPNGAYTVAPQGTDLLPLCPAVSPAPFTVNSDVQTLDLADSSTVQLDLQMQSGSGPARPGFIHHVYLSAHNQSAQVSGPVEVTLTFDAQMSYMSATGTPTVIGNTITWSLPPLDAYDWTGGLYVDLQVPPDVGLLGLPWAHTASISQPLAESDLTDNTAVESGIFTGSYDPNDKTAATSTRQSTSAYFIAADEYVDYTIRFQNTGTDTAFTVVVTDTLDTDLDMGSYEQGVASHPFSVSFRPGRVVAWTFADILLPDSNTNEAASHGLVRFRIRPHLPLAVGTELRNNGDIFFDFNDPVRTNDAVLTAELGTRITDRAEGEWLVYPNPSQGAFVVELGAMHRSTELELQSVTGQVLARSSAQNTDRVVLAPELAPGVYMLTVRADDAVRSFRVVRK